MNKINKQNRNRLMDTENRLTDLVRRGVASPVKKCEGIKPKNKQTNTKTSQTQTKVW